MKAILIDSYRELKHRKTLAVFIIINLLALLILYSTSGAEIPEEMVTPKQIYFNFVSSLMSLLVFISVIATAGLVPDMFSKGRSEYFLSKPITRTALFLNKFFSVFMVYGFIVTGSFLTISLASTFINNTAFLSAVPILVTQLVSLFIWLSLTLSIGIMSRSYSTSLITAFLIGIMNMVLGMALNTFRLGELLLSPAWATFLKYLHFAIPNNSEVVDIGFEYALKGKVTDFQPIVSSIIFSILLLFIAINIFKKKDY